MPQSLVFTAPPRTWIQIEGPDAQDFLHRLTTAHVRALPEGGGTPSCLLNAQGRIRSSFVLWRTGAQAFGIEVDPFFQAETLAVIDQYTFGEKMTVQPRADWVARWVLPAETAASARRCAREGEALVCEESSRDFGRALITVWGPRAEVDARLARQWPDARAASEAELEKLRVLALAPRAGHEVTPDSNPLEIGLRDSIADNKGCYPGQEVIEKIIAIGEPARRLVLLEIAEGSAQPRSAVLDESGQEVGLLTSLAAPDRALAIVRKTRASESTPLHTAAGLKARVLKVASYE